MGVNIKKAIGLWCTVLLVACGGGAAGDEDLVASLVDTVAAADFDGDGIPDSEDDDIDGDGLLNDDELSKNLNPFDPDTDDDDVGDAVDNCPLTSNTAQDDADNDGVGNACVDDNDSDGLSDRDESKVYGTDPNRADSDGDGWDDPYEALTSKTNPLRADSDGDDVSDPHDAFPHDPEEWDDTDGDGVGDRQDNCPEHANPTQRNTDAKYADDGLLAPDGESVVADDIGDACDEDRDGDRTAATYVDVINGSDDNLGTFAEPVQSVTRALEIAADYEDDIYLAAGRYNVGAVTWPDGAHVRGGYATGYTARLVKSPDVAFDTVLYRSEANATIELAGRQDIRFDGVRIEQAAVEGDVATVTLSGSGVSFIDSIIELAPAALNAVAIQAQAQSALTLERSMVRTPSDAEVDDAAGVVLESSSGRIVNNVMIVEGREHSRGVVAAADDVVVVHNTIVSGLTDSALSSAVELRGVGTVVANNILVTRDADDQAALRCVDGDAQGAVLEHNVLASFDGLAPQAVAVNCFGEAYAADEFAVNEVTFSSSTLRNHTASPTAILPELLDVADWSVRPLVDVGAANADLNIKHDVQDNYAGASRSAATVPGAW